MKRQNSLNVPYLNSKFHFKMYTELAGGYKSKVLELWILSNFYFWRFFELLYKFGSNLDFKMNGILVNKWNSTGGQLSPPAALLQRSRRARGRIRLCAGMEKLLCVVFVSLAAL